MALALFRRKKERKPSMKKKLFFSLGSLAMILLLSSVISILEYRRMSDYVSELIAANIKSINLARKLSDITQEYNHQMLAVVVQNDISRMPQFDFEDFKNQEFACNHDEWITTLEEYRCRYHLADAYISDR